MQYYKHISLQRSLLPVLIHGEEETSGENWLFGSLLLHRIQGYLIDCCYINKLINLHIQIEPVRIKSPNTTVGIIYGSSLVQVEKEELTFPLTSLIADCGGILGLFVGFNFIMVWQLLVFLVKKVSRTTACVTTEI